MPINYSEIIQNKCASLTDRQVSLCFCLITSAVFLTKGCMSSVLFCLLFVCFHSPHRVQSGSYLSTGWFTFILAMDACYGIHVYGMINDTYCKTEGYRKVPYHYYEQGRDECDEYFLHEHAPYGGHRFITEKKVFAKWAKKHRIIFTHPNWTVS
uniref:Alpha-N-acetylgalactosaminide alpha-2,6-sialyltransferase 3 n=2 Tax=Laurasiatheria TaxID=314145 RepID=A0A8C2P2Y9_CAPHI